MIEEFVADICGVLKIGVPVISHDASTFPTTTTKAQYTSVGNTIHIAEFKKPTLDTFFCIAHELRHAWQIKYHPEMLDSYLKSDELSVDNYNLQDAELDANAFGVVVMVDFFGVKPQFNGMPEDIRRKIYDMAKTITTD